MSLFLLTLKNPGLNCKIYINRVIWKEKTTGSFGGEYEDDVWILRLVVWQKFTNKLLRDYTAQHPGRRQFLNKKMTRTVKDSTENGLGSQF
jgi:hypothetical protein